jgi:hypothetical protein
VPLNCPNRDVPAAWAGGMDPTAWMAIRIRVDSKGRMLYGLYCGSVRPDPHCPRYSTAWE